MESELYYCNRCEYFFECASAWISDCPRCGSKDTHRYGDLDLEEEEPNG